MRIIHIINSLNKGGAEGNLFRLSERQKKKYKNKIEITIITLIKNGYYENKLKKKGIKILSLNFNQKDKLSFLIKKIIRLRYILRTINLHYFSLFCLKKDISDNQTMNNYGVV